VSAQDTPNRRRAGLRLAARLAYALLLLLVAALALEFYESWRYVQGERDADHFMKRYHIAPPFMRQIDPVEQQHLIGEGLKPQEYTAGAERVIDAVAPTELSPDEAQRRFWELYALPDDEGNARAALAGEHWLLFDESSRLEREIGDTYSLANFPEASPQLSRFYLLGDLEPGATTEDTNASHPMWSRRVTRLATTDPVTGATKSLFYSRLLLPRPTLEELAQAYARDEQSHLLVPGYINRPGLTAGPITDQFGFPNRPVVLPKPEHTFRIVCIGGSTTHEADVGQPRTTEYLGQLFDQQFPGKSVEVINCGIAGSNSFDLRRHVYDYLGYEPDVLIYYEGVNDIVGLQNIWGDEAIAWRRLLLRSRFLSKYFNHGLQSSVARFEGDWNRSTRRNLLAIRLAAEAAGVPLICASFAWVQHDMLSRSEANYIDFNALTTWGMRRSNYGTLSLLLQQHNALLKELCEKHGMGYVPLSEHFHHGMSHFVDFCHNTPVGMQERARILHAWLTPWIEARLAQGDAPEAGQRETSAGS